MPKFRISGSEFWACNSYRKIGRCWLQHPKKTSPTFEAPIFCSLGFLHSNRWDGKMFGCLGDMSLDLSHHPHFFWEKHVQTTKNTTSGLVSTHVFQNMPSPNFPRVKIKITCKPPSSPGMSSFNESNHDFESSVIISRSTSFSYIFLVSLHMGVSKHKDIPKWMVKIMGNPIKIY